MPEVHAVFLPGTLTPASIYDDAIEALDIKARYADWMIEAPL